MIKLYLNTKDYEKAFEINFAHIFTNTYSKKLVSYEFHVPIAAKIICHFEGQKVRGFLLEQPIIDVRSNGDIHIWVDQKYEETIFKISDLPRSRKDSKDRLNSEYLKNLKNINKYMKAKSLIGLSIEDIIEHNDVKSKIDMENLKSKRAPKRWGGGL